VWGGTRGARGLDIGTSLGRMNGLAEPEGEGVVMRVYQ
jgi:hypothetical protein